MRQLEQTIYPIYCSTIFDTELEQSHWPLQYGTSRQSWYYECLNCTPLNGWWILNCLISASIWRWLRRNTLNELFNFYSGWQSFLFRFGSILHQRKCSILWSFPGLPVTINNSFSLCLLYASLPKVRKRKITNSEIWLVPLVITKFTLWKRVTKELHLTKFHIGEDTKWFLMEWKNDELLVFSWWQWYVNNSVWIIE